MDGGVLINPKPGGPFGGVHVTESDRANRIVDDLRAAGVVEHISKE